LDQEKTVNTNLFDKMVFFLNREVPKYLIEPIILSFGGQCYSEDDEYNEQDITHIVIDRPITTDQLKKNKEYVQPQWIFDSINNSHLLATDNYKPGQVLPPHLSPFVDN
jgi:pescadillo protein